MSVIKTYDASGVPNGIVIPLWHTDTGPRIDQVYLTTINRDGMKGPHLHMKRRGLFFCIRGVVLVVQRWRHHGTDVYRTSELSPGSLPQQVMPGTPAALYNIGLEEALVLNMPSPPWRVGEEDEHEVTDWTWKP